MINTIETLDLRVYKVRGTDPRAKLYREVISQIKTTTNPRDIKTGIISFINEFMPDPLFLQIKKFMTIQPQNLSYGNMRSIRISVLMSAIMIYIWIVKKSTFLLRILTPHFHRMDLAVRKNILKILID